MCGVHQDLWHSHDQWTCRSRTQADPMVPFFIYSSFRGVPLSGGKIDGLVRSHICEDVSQLTIYVQNRQRGTLDVAVPPSLPTPSP